MGFAQELKEFTGGFEKGWKLATPSAAELKDRKDRQEAAELKAAGDKAEGEMGSGVAPYTYKSGEGGAAEAGGKLPSFVNADLMSKAKNAISGLESGGNYDALGPQNAKYGYPVGKYQVMEANIPQWTQEALGKPLTSAQFRADPKAQEAVFEHRFGSYLAQNGGNVADAASRWHSGKPLSQAGGRKDVLGTSTVDYARRAGRAAGQRADAGITFDDEPVQYAAEGGMIMSREELEREQALREARAASMPSEDAVPVAAQTSWRDPSAQAGIPEAVRVAPDEATTVAPGAEVQARGPDTPLPPRRPAGIEVTRGSNTPMPPRRPEEAQLRDSGAPLPGEGMTADSDEAYDPRMVAHTPGVGEAIDAGMKAIGKAFGFSEDSAGLPTARPDRQVQLAAFHRNEGAATQEDIRSIDRTIDPGNKLSEDARAVARLYGGYKYFLSKGEPDKAANYAKSILQYTRLHMQTAGALAEERIKAGDLAGGAKLIQEAHNQVPDGSSLYVDQVDPKTGKVDYRMVDEDGDLTERGQASTNQLLALATGMRNGSEWLSQMESAKKGSLTAAQKLREKNRQKDQDNLETFQAGDTDSDFLNSLSPERREAFTKMSPRVQRQVTQDWRRQQDQKRAQDTQEERYRQNDARTARLDKQSEERQRLADEKTKKAEKDALDQQEYAGHRDAIRDAADDLAEAQRLDPDDTATLKPLEDKLKAARAAASDWTKADGGRAKYTRDLDRVLKPSRGSGGTAEGAASGGKGTADERKTAGLEAQFVREQRRVAREGNKPEDQAKLGALRASIEFQKRDTGFDDKVLPDLNAALPKALGVKDIENVKPEDRMDYRDAATGILRGDNGIAVEDALDIARLAAKTGKIERLDDGRYQVNGARPVYMSPEAIQAIARIRQRANPKKQEEVKNPFDNRGPRRASDGEMSDAQIRAGEIAERRGGRRGNIRNAAEADRMKNQLGDEYRDGMTLPQMRRALRDRERNSEFRERSLPPLT